MGSVACSVIVNSPRIAGLTRGVITAHNGESGWHLPAPAAPSPVSNRQHTPPAAVRSVNTFDTVHVRDSKIEEGPQLTHSPASWTGFVAYAAQA
ncbi:DUF397 domain-containing protein [Streptomyces sp. NPDC058545]|uniref:DUF397 domain-containing protein n=1 Tax=Streptomyces sp. NPDC058545 TaxID=3346544 RepID=UPI003650F852